MSTIDQEVVNLFYFIHNDHTTFKHTPRNIFNIIADYSRSCSNCKADKLFLQFYSPIESPIGGGCGKLLTWESQSALCKSCFWEAKFHVAYKELNGEYSTIYPYLDFKVQY
jgi:hypothetical protein